MADDVQLIVEALAARIDTLEMKSAFQDQVIEHLNKVVVDQWGRLEQALRRMDRLEDRLRDVQASAGTEPQDEPPPPHY